MAGAWKTVRIFVSSTFRDMHAERNHLVKITFPRLRQWCEERRLHLVDIDLRWGVTKEEADNGKAVEICLEEIDGSRPFFLCILGNRYGCVPKANEFPVEATDKFRGLRLRTHCSITHLEIIHAIEEALNPVDPRPLCQHAFFYFRRPESLPDPASLKDLTTRQRTAYAEAYFERTSEQVAVLAELKRTLRERYRGRNCIYDYSARWDEGSSNPEDPEVKGCLTDLDEFGNRVEEDLRRAIEIRFREHIERLSDRDPLGEERAYHEAFIENRTRVHVPRADIEDKITGYVQGEEPFALVISGPAGSGKSATLAHWARAFAPPSSSQKPWLLARFIGASPASTSLHRLLANICAELVNRFELTEEVEVEAAGGIKTKGARLMAVPADPVKLQQQWPRFLEAAGRRGRILLILDAINQLDQSGSPERLDWIARRLPPGVRMIVSALDHGANSRPESIRAGEKPDWLAALRRAGLPELVVPELSDEGRRRIIKDLPSVFCKSLDTAQVDELLRNNATRNPLFLIVALEELRVFGSFELLAREIGRLPQQTDPEVGGDIEKALDCMFGRVLDRLERDTARTPGLVRALMSYLSSAREGLCNEDLRALLAARLPSLLPKDRDAAAEVVLRQVRAYLMRKGALIDFYHRSFWKAVRQKYLSAQAARYEIHRELSSYFSDQPYFAQARGDTFGGEGSPAAAEPNVNKVVELPWQLLQAALESNPDLSPEEIQQEWAPLEEVHCDLDFVEAKCAAGMAYELLADYTAALRAGRSVPWPGRRRVAEFDRFVRSQAHVLPERPGITFQQAHNEPDASSPAQEARRRWERAENRAWLQWINKPQHHDHCLATLTGHKDSVTCCCYSADGSLIASGSDDKTLRLWDGETYRPLAAMEDTEQINDCCFSPDGRRLVSATSARVLKIWDVQRLYPIAELEGHTDIVTCCCYSPDGRTIASGSWDTTVRIWDAGTFRLIATLAGHSDRVNSCRFSPIARRLVSASQDKTLIMWDTESYRPYQTMQGHTSAVTSACYSPDGWRVLSGSWDKTLRAWDGAGSPLGDLQTQSSQILSCCYSPDGRKMVSASGRNLKLWDTGSETLRATLSGHGGAVRACCYSPDGRRILSASADGVLKVWDADPEFLITALEAHGDEVAVCAYSPDGRVLVSGSHDRTLKVWDGTSNKMLASLEGHSGGVKACCFSPDGRRILSGSDDRTLRIWDAQTYALLGTLEGHSGPVICCCCSPDGHFILSGSQDASLIVWDAKSLEKITTLSGHSGAVSTCCCSADGRRILSGSHDKTLRVWDGESFELLATLEGHINAVTCCCYSPDCKRILSGCWFGTLRFWDAETFGFLGELGRHRGPVTSCAYSPDGRWIISGSLDKTVRIWEVEFCDSIATLEGHTGWVKACCFSPNGRRIASCSADKTVKIWDAEAAVFRVPREHLGEVTACSFFTDGGRILTGSSDRTMKIWGAESGVLISKLEGHSWPVAAVCQSPDGRRLVSGSLENTLLWDLASATILRRLYDITGAIWACSFSPDGRWVALAGANHEIKLVNPATLQAEATLRGPSSRVNCICFSPDACLVVAGSDDNVARVWHVRTLQSAGALEGHNGRVTSCCFSPDGKRIVSAAWDGSLRMWDAADFRLQETIKAGGPWLSWCGYSSDGRHIVAGAMDSSLSVFDARSLRLLTTFMTGGGIECGSIADDWGRIAVGDRLGRLYLLKPMGFEPGAPIVSATRLFSPDMNRWENDVTVKCGWCARRLTFPQETLQSIIGSTSMCPHCAKPLRLNSFVVDNLAPAILPPDRAVPPSVPPQRQAPAPAMPEKAAAAVLPVQPQAEPDKSASVPAPELPGFREKLASVIVSAVLAAAAWLLYRHVSWGWWISIPLAAYALINLAVALLPLIGLNVVNCPRCGGSAYVWRRHKLICRKCGEWQV